MRLAFLSFLLLASLLTKASSLWMEPQMHYFKIKVAENGLYKIEQNQVTQALSSAGFSASTIDSTKWALFFRGQEMAIKYEFGSIYFYGQKNDASLDTGLYFDSEPVNPHINMHSDSSAYFLTWYQDSRIGKRTSVMSITNPQIIPYHFNHKLWLPSTFRYCSGENYFTDNSALVYMGSFQKGEGWTGDFSSTALNMTISGVSNMYSQGPNPQLKVRINCESKGNNLTNISLGNASPRVWRNGIGSTGFGAVEASGEIIPSDIENNSLSVNYTISSGSFSSIYGTLYYPEIPGMYGSSDKVFTLDSTQSSTQTIIISDLSISSASEIFAYDISDVHNIRICEINYNTSSGDVSISVNGCNSIQRKVVVGLNSAINTVSTLTHRTYQNLQNPDQSFLIVYPDQFDSAAQAYTSYRESAQGGNYNVLKISIQEVYDQFSYGEFNPVAIHELGRYMHNQSSASSIYLFLMGKGLLFNATKRIGTIVYRWRFNPEQFTYENLIPSFGYPGGDWPFAMNILPQNKFHIAFGVGRITSRSQQQVFDYLDKVKEFEDPANSGLWKKRLLHLSGGDSDQEISNFFGYVNEFKDIAEGPFLGGRVETISKTNSSGLQTIFVDSSINNGIALLTMYGHSSVQFNDIQIGDVNDPNLNYNNGNGQYPMFIINGCETGRIYEELESWAQNWINTPSKGATLMLAHAFQGFDPILKHYTREIYETAFADSAYFGLPIGDILSKASQRFYDDYINISGKFVQSQIELMALQGDPALRISGGVGLPDYSVKSSEISSFSIDGGQITTNTDSFQLKIPIENYGRVADHFIGILVERISPQYRSFDTVYIPSFGYSDTVLYTVYNNPDNQLLGGINEFRIKLDPGNLIAEGNENNNLAVYSIIIPYQNVRNISPVNFGIVPTTEVRLVSSGQLPQGASSIIYQFELDTSYKFDSPLKKIFQKESGVIGIWDTGFPSSISGNDSTVYYWRSKKLEDTLWSESSFTYINESPAGWSQSAFGQYVQNDLYGGLELNPATKLFEFGDFESELNVRFAGHFGGYRDTTFIQVGNSILRQKGNLETRPCALRSILFVRISGRTGQPYRDLSNTDFRNCGIQPFGIRHFNQTFFDTDSLEGSILNFINTVRDDDYIMMVRHGNLRFDKISQALKDTLFSFGIDTAIWPTFINNEPFFFLGKKNWPGAILLRGDTSLSVKLDSQVFDFNYVLEEFYRNGEMISTRIGPAAGWGTINYSLEKEPSDNRILEIEGFRNNNTSAILKSDLSEGITDLSDINPSEFPWLKLNIYVEDTLNRTSPQLNNWTVIYQGEAEGIIDPLAFGDSTYQNISMQEGDTLLIPFSFKNVSEFNFQDSLLVRFSISENYLKEIYIPGPKAGDSTIFDFDLVTTGLKDDYTLRIFVNPFEIPELYYDNNILEVPFNIYRDNTQPIVNATFDNKRIINGDIVAYNTLIRMTLQDENPFFKVQDSGSVFFEIYKVDNFGDSLLTFPKSTISWKPQTDTGDFEVKFRPDSLHDGFYKLEFNGRDASGNIAGPFPKVIEFEVQSAVPSSFNDLLIYPNPFQNSLFMDFNLSGKDLPEKFFVEIYDLRGRQVFQANLKDQIKLGNNRIMIWDGKNGNEGVSPSGLYIYRIAADGVQINSQSSPIIGKVLFQP